MNLKSLSAIALGTTVALQVVVPATSSQAMPADQWHWSSAVKDGKFFYNGKRYTINEQKMGAAASFVQSCQTDVRVRGFLRANGKEDWRRAEFLCGQLSVGGDVPVAYNPGGEIKVFNRIYMTKKNNVMPECRPYSNSSKRVWSNCGAIVPNDRTSSVFIGDGTNKGMALKTDNIGSGIDTVEPVLMPKVESMRQAIFAKWVAEGKYNKK